MSDQAQQLRELMASMGIKARQLSPEIEKPKMKIITVASGKGGVGKSTYSTNLAIAIAGLGHHPIILDADFGLANVEIILGQTPKKTLANLLHDEHTKLKDILTTTNYGVSFISGGSAVKDMMFLKEREINLISQKLKDIEEEGDVLIIDTGAGINDVVIKFALLADEIHIVIVPEPTSIMDGYALIKTLLSEFGEDILIKVIINKAQSEKDAQSVFNKISNVCNSVLQKEIYFGGFVPLDVSIGESAMKQVPVLGYKPNSESSKAYSRIANRIMSISNKEVSHVKDTFYSKLKNILSFKK